jgi:hypothetical protein
VITRLETGSDRLVLYLSPDAGSARWRQPFITELACHFSVWQLHYRLGHLDELILQVLATGRRWDAVLLDTNSYGLTRDHLATLRDTWGAAVVQFWIDQRETLQDELKDRADLLDLLVWTNTCPAQSAQAFNAGVRDVALIWPTSDDGVYFPDPQPARWDMVFVGNDYGLQFGEGGLERRAAVVSCAKAGLSVRVVGEGWGWATKHGIQAGPADFAGAAEIMQQGRVVLSVSHYNDIPGYTSDRLLNCIFSGVPTVARFFPGADDFIRPGWCQWYEDPAQLPGLVRKMIDDTRFLDAARRASHEARSIYGRARWAARMAHYIDEAIECHNAR